MPSPMTRVSSIPEWEALIPDDVRAVWADLRAKPTLPSLRVPFVPNAH